MEKNKKVSTGTSKISSRNRNKNKNQALQNKTRERKIAKVKMKSESKPKVVLVHDDELLFDEVLSNNQLGVEELRVEDEVEEVVEEVPVLETKSTDGFTRFDFSAYKSAENKVSDRFNFVDKKEEKSVIDEYHTYTESDSNMFPKQSSVAEVIQADDYNSESRLFVDEDVKDVSSEEEYGNKIMSQLTEEKDDEERNFDIEKYLSSNEETVKIPTNNVDINARRYISFEKRVITLISAIFLAFFIAGLFLVKSVVLSGNNSIVYDEISSIDYKVCVDSSSNDDFYSDSCLDENMEYLTSIVNKVPVKFNYSVNYSGELDGLALNYYVASKTSIYREKGGKILNSYEDILVERTAYDVAGSSANLELDVDVLFNNYLDYYKKYFTKYSLGNYAEVETALYVDNGNSIKKVASVVMPLSEESFNVESTFVNNMGQNLTVQSNGWEDINESYAAVGLFFVLLGVFGIVKLSNLVCKVVGTTSLYQRKLQKILKEYDRVIVNSRGDYKIDSNKKLVKVESFRELLDARNTLDKPIVYVKVNNVKSEFYVEDNNTIFKYTMKEVDIEEEN